MRALLILLAALIAAPLSVAETVTVDTSWSIPTTREDGSALPVADLAGYALYYSVDGAEPVKIDIAGGATKSHALQIPLQYRTERYTVGMTIVAVDSAGRTSAHSNMVTKAFTLASDAPPSSPANIGFHVSCPSGCRVTVEPL